MPRKSDKDLNRLIAKTYELEQRIRELQQTLARMRSDFAAAVTTVDGAAVTDLLESFDATGDVAAGHTAPVPGGAVEDSASITG